ncbi:MAG TPA: HAMP domain-containing sensor histidine kinase [Gemmatimonas sp.]|uniref:sensor histidine kinase n=1 Tax=Gemmatimonas sp. TaxID=1962908 RepID=UPI002EDA3B98
MAVVLLIVLSFAWVNWRTSRSVAETLDLLQSGTQAMAQDLVAWSERPRSLLMVLMAMVERVPGGTSAALFERVAETIPIVPSVICLGAVDSMGSWLKAPERIVSDPGRRQQSSPALALLASPCPTSVSTDSRLVVDTLESSVPAGRIGGIVTPAGDTGYFGILILLRLDDAAARRASSNPSRRERATVLFPLGDHVLVFSHRGNLDTKPAARRYEVGQLPEVVRIALGRSGPARPASALGVGLDGNGEVLMAAHPIPTLGMVLFREVEPTSMISDMHNRALLEAIGTSVLIMLLLIVARERSRAAHAQKERDLARVRSDFVSLMSHELRTPLAQIRLFAELLAAGRMATPRDATRGLGIIAKESQRLGLLVENLLGFAMPRSDSNERRVQRVDLELEVRHAVDAFAPITAERRAHIALSPSVDGTLHALIDHTALRQIMNNLLDNALKYGPPGQTVTVSILSHEDTIRVLVDDEGAAIAPTERERVFAPFVRTRAASASGVPGSGIGLAVVRQLAEAHQAAVWMETAPGGGNRAVLELQRAHTSRSDPNRSPHEDMSSDTAMNSVPHTPRDMPAYVKDDTLLDTRGYN